VSYHWQARTIDSNGVTSSWSSFGNNSEAAADFAKIARRVAREKQRCVLERNGKPFVAVVPLEDLEAIERIEDAIDLAAVRRARRATRTIPYDVVRRKLGLAR
jgi:PHD/YefM family antitoxin component YafN of YafNO toxin-antitoxin module